MSLHRSRYTFSIVLLDTCRELLHYLGASQLPMELDGSLTYNHEEWMSAQEVCNFVMFVICVCQLVHKVRTYMTEGVDIAYRQVYSDAMVYHDTYHKIYIMIFTICLTSWTC